MLLNGGQNLCSWQKYVDMISVLNISSLHGTLLIHGGRIKRGNQLILEFKDAFEAEGLVIDATFGGLASYCYSQLLSPTKTQRDISYEFFKRAIDLTSQMGAEIIGTPVGGMSYNDSRNPTRRSELYNIMLGYIRNLASYGKKMGLKELQIEATPLNTEFPHSPEVSLQMMNDLEGTEIPVNLLIDWGHALYEPLLKNQANMEIWLRKCKPYVGSIHLQQTDGKLDQHWDFTKDGIITADLIKRTAELTGTEDIIQYLEVVTNFEDTDDAVYEGMKKTMDFLHGALDW